MNSRIAILFSAAFLAAAIVWGQEAETQVWPELDVYYRLNSMLRIKVAGGTTRSQELTNALDGFLQVDVDMSIKRLVTKSLLLLRNQERAKMLTLRTGYAFLPSFADENPPSEHRLFFEATARVKLPWEFVLNDRNRIDLRWIDREESKRYRNRIKPEREFSVNNFQFNTYVSTEFFYDSRSNSWNRNEYSGGVELPFLKNSILEFYYTRQDNKSSDSTDVNAIGVSFQIFLGM